MKTIHLKDLINEAVENGDLDAGFVDLKRDAGKFIHLEAVKDRIKAHLKCKISLDTIDFDARTEEICLFAVQCKPDNIEFVPHTVMTKEIKQEVLSRNGLLLYQIPVDKRTTEDYYTALESSKGRCGRNIPKEVYASDASLRELAVRLHGDNVNYIPIKYVDDKMFKLAATTGCPLDDIPMDLRTYDVCLATTKRDHAALLHVPSHLMSEELCLSSIHHYPNHYTLSNIPSEFLTENVLMEYVRETDGHGYEDIPEDKRTPALLNEAFKLDAMNLRFYDKEEMTYEQSLDAVRREGSALQYVSEDLIDDTMCVEALKNDINSVRWMPDVIPVNAHDQSYNNDVNDGPRMC